MVRTYVECSTRSGSSGSGSQLLGSVDAGGESVGGCNGFRGGVERQRPQIRRGVPLPASVVEAHALGESDSVRSSPKMRAPPFRLPGGGPRRARASLIHPNWTSLDRAWTGGVDEFGPGVDRCRRPGISPAWTTGYVALARLRSSRRKVPRLATGFHAWGTLCSSLMGHVRKSVYFMMSLPGQGPAPVGQGHTAQFEQDVGESSLDRSIAQRRPIAYAQTAGSRGLRLESPHRRPPKPPGTGCHRVPSPHR